MGQEEKQEEQLDKFYENEEEMEDEPTPEGGEESPEKEEVPGGGGAEEDKEEAGGEEPDEEEEESLEALLGEEPAVETPEEEVEEPEEPEEPEEELESDFSFEMDDDVFEELAENKDKFADFIKGAVEYGRKQAEENLRAEMDEKINNAREEILKNIPDVVGRTAQRQQALKTTVKNFYEKNPALSDKKEYVRDMTKVVQSSNPDWSADKILNEVAARAKRDLNISEEANKRERKRKPPFAGSGGRRSPSGNKDTRTKTEKQLDSFFSSSKS